MLYPYAVPYKDKADWAAYMKRRRDAKIADGLCGNCGVRPRDGELKLCEHCNGVRAASAAARHREAREALFAQYGGKACACCGVTEEKFLAFDHVNGDGSAHRRELRPATKGRAVPARALYLGLKRKGFPPVLQVLCHNCNFGRHLNGGVCPHKEDEEAAT